MFGAIRRRTTPYSAVRSSSGDSSLGEAATDDEVTSGLTAMESNISDGPLGTVLLAKSSTGT
jgi:hypothetical protein